MEAFVFKIAGVHSSLERSVTHHSIHLASYFRAVHLTLYPFIRLASYFQVRHLALHPSRPFGELFLSFSSIHWYGE